LLVPRGIGRSPQDLRGGREGQPPYLRTGMGREKKRTIFRGGQREREKKASPSDNPKRGGWWGPKRSANQPF